MPGWHAKQKEKREMSRGEQRIQKRSGYENHISGDKDGTRMQY